MSLEQAGVAGHELGQVRAHARQAKTEGLPQARHPYEQARRCLEQARSALVELQHPEGWWKGELETNVTMDAEDLFLRQFLGILTADQLERSAKWIRSKQRPDGTWSNFYGGPPDLSTTIEAYVALKLAGDQPSAEHMQKASRFAREAGGLAASRVFTRIWLALFGRWSWDELPVLPPEIMLLPRWVPLNIYDFGCWARQTIVPLAIVSAHRPAKEPPFGLEELEGPVKPPAAHTPSGWTRFFRALDRGLHLYERRPIVAIRRLSLARAEQWILKRQESDGSWGGIQPPWVYSLIALHLQGYGLDHPVMVAGIKGLDSFTIEDESGRRLEACQSPVWDSALALIALSDAGLPIGDPTMDRAASWLKSKEIALQGDWSIKRPGLAPSGWSFEFANDNYPDVDDTAEVLLALMAAGRVDDHTLQRGLSWLLGMQCSDGGWGAFDVDNTQELCRELPFCDFGELIDPPSADVTAHVVELLAKVLRTRSSQQISRHLKPAIERGVRWLKRAQETDGSWFGRWGANYIYGTGAVVPALVAAGTSPDDPAVSRAVRWLLSCQNEDGGWGEDLRSYDDTSWRGKGASTASQTAWALLALMAAGVKGEQVDRAVGWLSETQLPEGTWDEPWFTGTGFPGDFYINYHLYRLVFPVMALGRYITGACHG